MVLSLSLCRTCDCLSGRLSFYLHHLSSFSLYCCFLSVCVLLCVQAGNKVISSLSYSTPANLLASGHHDKIIRIWDPRKQDKEVIRYTLRSHLGWVSDVSFSPSNPHQLVSSSYDNSIKVWDLRSSLPLHTVKAHDDKALCVDWAADEIVLSGGADKQLRACRVRRGAAVAEEK